MAESVGSACRPAHRQARLYATIEDFVKTWDAATAGEVRKDYLLKPDARTLDKVAAASNIGG